ncbi:outer membrane beta-barrel protein [Cesiribacter sp. SM1]|uniref:outer membrane beta-barrel protein n=1 Tax=Cesiribacter sp. SM1 TaxID=2861196 RepID=UPI001CD7D458|nr:outer membrane beta-barrel protein [Cesiribacter sp. SM1]
MIRFLLLTFISIYGLHPVHAQLSIGPKAGTHVSLTRFAESDYRASHTSYIVPGYHGGIAANYKANKLYSIQFEFLYSRIGRHVVRTDPYRSRVTNRSSYHYINMPIMLRLSKHKAIRGNHLEVYMNVGPSFNYWLGGSGRIASSEIEENTSMNPMPYDIHFNESQGSYINSMYVAHPNRLQMSLDFGGGVLFDLGFSNHIFVDLRTSLGIGKTYMGEKNGGDFGLFDYTENLEAVNHIFAVSAGYSRDFDLRAIFVKGKIKRR